MDILREEGRTSYRHLGLVSKLYENMLVSIRCLTFVDNKQAKIELCHNLALKKVDKNSMD